MATEQPAFSFTVLSNADLSSDQYKFVKINSSGKAALVAAVGTDFSGVLQNAPAAADRAATLVRSGITKIKLGGTVAVGDKVRITAAGLAILADSDEVVGEMLSAGASGGVGTLLLYGAPTRIGPLFVGTYNEETLAATKTLVVADAIFQKLDPGGAARNVDLPAEALSRGKAFFITNAADGVEPITVRDDAAATIVTIPQNEAAWVVCDGTTWIHMGILTIQLS